MIFNLADTHLFFNDLEVRLFAFLPPFCFPLRRCVPAFLWSRPADFNGQMSERSKFCIQNFVKLFRSMEPISLIVVKYYLGAQGML